MTASTNLGINLVAHGAEVDTWDTPTNDNWDVVDAWVGSSTSLNATGLTGDQTLGLTDYQKGQLIVSGVPTGTVTYVVPSSVGGKWIFENNATGSFSTVGIKSATGGSTIQLATGTRTYVICDGSATGMKLALTSGAAAGGSTNQVQVNLSGALTGYSALTFDGTTLTTNALRTTGNATFGDASSDFVTFNAATLTINNNTTFGGLYLEYNGSKRVAIGTTSFGSLGALFRVAGLIEATAGGFIFPDGTTQATAAGQGSAYGSNNWIQYALGGSLRAQSNFTFDPGTGIMAVPQVTASSLILAPYLLLTTRSRLSLPSFSAGQGAIALVNDLASGLAWGDGLTGGSTSYFVCNVDGGGWRVMGKG